MEHLKKTTNIVDALRAAGMIVRTTPPARFITNGLARIENPRFKVKSNCPVDAGFYGKTANYGLNWTISVGCFHCRRNRKIVLLQDAVRMLEIRKIYNVLWTIMRKKNA